jgi:hypothetical protein
LQLKFGEHFERVVDHLNANATLNTIGIDQKAIPLGHEQVL